VLVRARKEFAGARAKVRGRLKSTLRVAGLPSAGIAVKRFCPGEVKAVLTSHGVSGRLPTIVHAQAVDAMAHRFDLLGSGPVVVVHGMRCQGLEGCRYNSGDPVCHDSSGCWLEGRVNRANLDDAKRIWGLVDSGYVPIDWQLDFKSGYRWSEDTWHRGIRFGHLPGVDVKVPWELARMQHLPALAMACHFALAGVAGFESAESYAREFRNQALDFVATNPPGFGVNWACAMDVAIRAANFLFARDLVLAAGVCFDDAFEAVFAASMLAHGRHVVANLEWAPKYRGNHYLADIVGLLFVAAYLPGSEETDAWLAFAVQELLIEVGYQFHEDGSSFEASVCYHRLSAEMVMWAFALLVGLSPEKRSVLQHPHRHPSLARLRPQAIELHPLPGRGGLSPIPAWAWLRLERMADFTRAMTRPDGLVVQFGDNDSGRFITLGSGEQLRAGGDPGTPGWSLDHSALLAGVQALLGGAPDPVAAIDDPGARILLAFAGLAEGAAHVTSGSSGCDSQPFAVGDESTWNSFFERFEDTADTRRWTSIFDAHSPGLLDGLQAFAFPGMGCYVVRSPRLYLAVRCGELGLAGLGAHAHCDQLAIELVIDGKSLVRDPGTLIYTPFPEKRNAYRSARAHHVPRVAGREPADLAQGLFDLRGAGEGECLYFGPRGFVGRHAGYGSWVWRSIGLECDRIVVRDFADGELPMADPTPDCLPFSPGYGRVSPERSSAQ
jgi:hypothetical protein